jgi:hypothetical protein
MDLTNNQLNPRLSAVEIRVSISATWRGVKTTNPTTDKH